MNSISDIGKNLAGLISENSPTILSSLAIGGLISTAVLSVKATPKALSLIEAEIERLDIEEYEKPRLRSDVESLPRMFSVRDTIRITWKCYIPAASIALASVVCIVQSNSINSRRIAAVAGAYTIAERALHEYQSKVVETIGKNKELRIRDEIASDRIKENPPGTNQVGITGKGDILCYDSISGRYFKSSVEHIRQVINNLNNRLMSEMYITLNELYYDLGLPRTSIGDDLVWDLAKGLIEIRFSTQLSEDQEPCLVLDYTIGPRYLK